MIRDFNDSKIIPLQYSFFLICLHSIHGVCAYAAADHNRYLADICAPLSPAWWDHSVQFLICC